MRYFAPKYRYDPNEKVDSLYYGVSPGGQTVTKVVKRSRTNDGLEATRTYAPGIPRGEGGNIATLIIGGMETTLAEMEDILEAKKEKKWVPRRSNSDIVEMCRYLIEQRNDAIRYFRKNPSEAPPKKKITLHLPVGCRMVDAPVPGLRVRI